MSHDAACSIKYSAAYHHLRLADAITRVVCTLNMPCLLSVILVTGDGCRRDENGYYWITGRVDDVINVSGHRVGTAEVESALASHDKCAEAAVIG